MGKKTAGGLIGTLVLAGVTLGVAKYLKDYAGVKFTDEEQLSKVKSDSSAVKDAAKRTYIAIKEKSNVKEAAAELSKAAGSVMTDAADIAKTAGTETVNAFKDMKTKYDNDPEGFKSELSENLGDMTQNIVKATQDTTQNIVKATQDKTGEIVDRIKGAHSDSDDGSFRLNYVDDEDNEEAEEPNVTITDDEM